MKFNLAVVGLLTNNYKYLHRMKMNKIIFLLITILITTTGCSKKGNQTSTETQMIPKPQVAPVKMPGLKKYFDEYKVNGCIVIYDLHNNIFTYYDSVRCNKEFIPASTFKIPNSLIALESGAIKDENEIIKWDGIKRNRPGWDEDTDLRRAFKNSIVWFYQELARRTGEKKMQHYVDTLDYGNKNISGGIDLFWLSGGLRITAMQQIFFLSKIFQNKLPVQQKNLDILKKIMILEETPGYTFRGKTGTAIRMPQSVGWFVGYLEAKNNVYFFALNIDIDEQGKDIMYKERLDIVKRIFNDAGLTNFEMN